MEGSHRGKPDAAPGRSRDTGSQPKEVTMTALKQSVQKPSRKWSEMGVVEKLVFLGKACVFVLSWGFVFPSLFDD